ncbi:DUF1758 domain-containing protein [Trichonephila clavipes]|nr:DUF1758 domain-containing protein [Trichonephila clavipes]
MGVLGNERADWLAKAATKRKIDIDVNIPKSFYKKITKERMVKSWNQEYLMSNKGSITKKFFPTINKRLSCHHFYTNYKLTQFLTGHEDHIRVVEDLDGTVESTDTIAKLKTKIKKSSTFESDPDFVKTLIKNCIDERVSRNEREATLEKQKIELAKLQLEQLEKEVELQTAKNEVLSLNPAAKVEEKQFETNIENMIKSIKILSLPVPTRSENFNLFFQSLERAFLTKKINDEYKSEILINLLTKELIMSYCETYIQFAARLTANFQYYCSLRKVNSFESLCDLLISDKLFETLNKEIATHIGIREAQDWFRPIDLAKECDIYISSRSGSRKETPIACEYTEDPFKNRPRNYKPKIKNNYPQNLERQNKNCYICGDSSHYARDSLEVETEEKSDRFEQTSRTLERKISMRSTKEELNSPSVTYTSSSVLEAYNTVVVTNSGFPIVISESCHACETQCFPVEPSGCRRGAFT